MGKEKLIKISNMAKMHGISRQTLILYDREGLFKPVYVSETGFRYYSEDQIPMLRLICLLKRMGVSLKRIGEFVQGEHGPADLVELLGEREADIQAQIDELVRQRTEVRQYSHMYEMPDIMRKNVGLPQVEWIEERQVLYSPYEVTTVNDMNRKKLHVVLMQAWTDLLDAGMIPSRGFGSMLDPAHVFTDEPLTNAGCIIRLPFDDEETSLKTVRLPAGRYVCMYKYGMPFDVGPARALLAWMQEHGLKATGNIIDICKLDAVFYDEEHKVDLCRLEVAIDET